MTPEQIATIRDGVRLRESARHAEQIRGLERVEIHVEDGLSYTAREPHGGDAVMRVSEPPERGGSGDGNSPLGHFLTGAGACLLNQFVRIAIADRLELAFIGANVRGEFARNPGGAFEAITFEVFAEGHPDEAAARQLMERAEALCYVHNTLRGAVRLTTILKINGQEAARATSQPG